MAEPWYSATDEDFLATARSMFDSSDDEMTGDQMWTQIGLSEDQFRHIESSYWVEGSEKRPRVGSVLYYAVMAQRDTTYV